MEGDDQKPTWDDDIDISDIHQSMKDDDEDNYSEAYDPSASTSKKPKKEKKVKRKREEEGFPLELLEAAKLGGDEARAELLEKMVDDYYKLDYEDKVREIIALLLHFTLRARYRCPFASDPLHHAIADSSISCFHILLI